METRKRHQATPADLGISASRRDAANQENVIKAAQTASLLRDDLQALVRSENPLLSEIAMRELEIAAALANRLDRIEGLLSKGE